jgi:hypothetical protein
LDAGTAKHSPAGDCGSHHHRALSERNATSGMRTTWILAVEISNIEV